MAGPEPTTAVGEYSERAMTRPVMGASVAWGLAGLQVEARYHLV